MMLSSRTPHTSVVTGGAGFIGSHLVDALVERGDDVIVIDDLSTGARERVHQRARIVQCDIRDANALLSIASNVGPAHWFHLAAQADVRRSVREPLEDADINVLGTIAVLEAARSTRSPIVFTSTGGAIYPAAAARPTSERTLAAPLSPYGASKLAAEGVIGAHSRLNGLGHVVLRLANVYGPRQDPHGEAGVVAIFAERMRRGEPVTIHGTGAQTRDFVHVRDVVDALLAASDLALPDQAPMVLNVGTGVETSIRQLHAILARIIGGEQRVHRAPSRPGELEASSLDARRARTELAIPLDRELERGLVETVAALDVDRSVVPPLDRDEVPALRSRSTYAV